MLYHYYDIKPKAPESGGGGEEEEEEEEEEEGEVIACIEGNHPI